jgi:DNA primase
MPGRIPQSFIDELMARADIVEIIGSRVTLKKAGREYKACCPFHDEKTPSFWVSPDKQFYHCFGCGAHGTALGFLMQYDQLPFPEAVEDLASRLGLTVPREGGTPPGGTSTADDMAPLYDLLGQVAKFYATALQSSPRARDYARARGLQAPIIERFQIGYAPDAWDAVLKHFGGGTDAQRGLAAVGLIVEREGHPDHYYDRFRDRLMFPIRDTRGRVIAFGGRVLDRGEPKYLNSPETALFHKGRELYGLYETRLSRTALTRLVVVEGYMDAVQLHQAGVTCAVATLGTATTSEHLHRAFRLVNEIVFAFDGDRAGRAAAWRALHNVLPETRAGREIRFLFLPEGEDPDSLVRGEGRDAFEARLADSLPLSEYLVAHLREQADLSHADGKARFLAQARPLLGKVAAGVYRELLLERVAKEIGWSAEHLQEVLAASSESGEQGFSAAPGPSPTLPERRATSTAARRPGRGGLITQAIQLLLHFPAAAARISPEQCATLATVQQPGISVLHELLTTLREQPAASMAQTLERWRERAEYRRLCELAADEVLVCDLSAAERELREALARLIESVRIDRLEALLRRAQDLTDAEKLELQQLTMSRGTPSQA